MMETIGDRIREARKDAVMSRRELAKRIGARGESYVSELELNKIKRGSRLHRIAEVLHVSLSWLETGKGAKHLAPQGGGTAADASEAREADSTWLTYLRAPAATRAAIDLLLLPPKDRAARLGDHELARHCIEQLERLAPNLISKVKSA